MRNIRVRFIAIGLIISILCALTGIVSVTAQEVTIEKFHCSATLDDEFTDNEIIIMVMPDYNFMSYEVDDFSEIDCVAIRELTRNVEEDIVNRIILLTLSTHSKQNVLDSIELLEFRDDIYSAEPNYIESPCVTPNDSRYLTNQQWAIDRIQLPAAWDITTGSSTVYVGVIDSGIEATHEDLVNRVNTELSRCFSPYYDTALEDASGHGTKVAGIIGAEGNNELGIAGVCWNIQLVSLRVANTSGQFETAAVIDAIDYADSVGIQILNYSGGGYIYSQEAVNRYTAIQQYSGLFVCAAGNDNNDNDTKPIYPSDHNHLSNVISVGASDMDDKRWYVDSEYVNEGSNFGKNSVDLFAPGVLINTTRINNTYSTSYATSIATPFVTGVAALLLSAKPDLLACEIKDTILTNVDKIDALGGLCVTGGRLNAYNALTNVQWHATIDGHPTDAGHVRICTDHMRSKTIPHSYLYANSGSAGHIATCSECGFSVSDEHDMLYHNTGVDSGHAGMCKLCGYTCSEAHTWVSAGLKYRCNKCGVSATHAPVTPFMLSPEIQARLLQMNYVGDFAMDIGDGTVLCRVGDDYYLVRGRTEDTALSYLQNELSVVPPDLDAA